MDVDLLSRRFIFKAQFIKAFAFMRIGSQQRTCLMLGQHIGGLISGMIGATSHDGLIRIPLQE
ncbi:hypothetical protein D3C86_2094830 [compost metagenome]